MKQRRNRLLTEKSNRVGSRHVISNRTSVVLALQIHLSCVYEMYARADSMTQYRNALPFQCFEALYTKCSENFFS